MTQKEFIINEIESLPPSMLEEVADFIEYLKIKKAGKKLKSTSIASEKILSKDWLKPEEDQAWENL